MFKKCIRHKKGTVEYTIYTLEEAKKAGIKFTSWKEAKEGEYSSTDDGYVAVCYKKYVYARETFNVVAILYPFNSHIYNERDGKPIGNPKFIFHRKKKVKKPAPQRTIIMEPKIGVFAIVYLATCSATEAYRFIYPRSAIQKARYWGRQCLLSPEISERIEKELTILLERRGIARSSVPELMQEALKMARDKQDCTNFNRAVENIIKAHFPTERTRKSFRIIRKSTQAGIFADVITEEDERLKEHGTSDNDLLSKVQDLKSNDPDAVTKQTVDVSVVQERNTRLGESQNNGFGQTREEYNKPENKQDKTS